MQNYQCLSKSHLSYLEADNSYLYIDNSAYHENCIQ